MPSVEKRGWLLLHGDEQHAKCSTGTSTAVPQFLLKKDLPFRDVLKQIFYIILGFGTS